MSGFQLSKEDAQRLLRAIRICEAEGQCMLLPDEEHEVRQWHGPGFSPQRRGSAPILATANAAHDDLRRRLERFVEEDATPCSSS